MAIKQSHLEMLGKLPRIVFEEGKEKQIRELNQINLADSLMMLADIDHEREYSMCKAVARHLLGQVPESDNADLGEY
jgi:hypothetical protein